MLGDGTVVEGEGFGASATAFGEVVFNTGMVGYTETLTDPSYGGQILSLTYPLVGNYGVPRPSPDGAGIPGTFESDRIQARGLVVHGLAETASHWRLHVTLDEWLYSEGVPGIAGVDTRELAKKLRSGGVMMGALCASDEPIDAQEVLGRLGRAEKYGSGRYVREVSAKTVSEYGSGEPVVVIDAGAKNAILRNIVSMGYRAVRVPWDYTAEQVMSHSPRGIVVSNGPGDPQMCPETASAVGKLVSEGVPALGICLGAQIMGLAGGAGTYKLKYGHRGQNKPCLEEGTGRVYVTSQNHGYCIDPDSLRGSEYGLWFRNSDDGTVEGIRHLEKPAVAVQFHPEASPGPYDCRFVFEKLAELMGGR